MAGSYKQALYFPFLLSQEHWGNVGRENGTALEPILRSEVMRQWTTALSDMIFPLQRWQGWAAKLAALLTDKHQVPHHPKHACWSGLQFSLQPVACMPACC